MSVSLLMEDNMRDLWNVLIILSGVGVGIWLVVAGRKRYLYPDNLTPLSPYVRIAWYLTHKKGTRKSDPLENTKLVRIEALWAMISGGLLALLAVAGLIFGLLN